MRYHVGGTGGERAYTRGRTLFDISSKRYDQLLHDICLQNLHVVVAVDRAGIVGADGETHQGLYDMTILLSMPNIEILAPRDYAELDYFLYYAVCEAKGPVAVRDPRASESSIFADFAHVPVSKAQVLKAGSDISLLFAGFIGVEVYEAAEILEKDGIFCEVIDLRRVKPLDGETILASLRRQAVLFAVKTACTTTESAQESLTPFIKRSQSFLCFGRRQ
jgi:1-deoxy-D-xylulose-5-phosphate synthase